MENVIFCVFLIIGLIGYSESSSLGLIYNLKRFYRICRLCSIMTHLHVRLMYKFDERGHLHASNLVATLNYLTHRFKVFQPAYRHSGTFFILFFRRNDENYYSRHESARFLEKYVIHEWRRHTSHFTLIFYLQAWLLQVKKLRSRMKMFKILVFWENVSFESFLSFFPSFSLFQFLDIKIVNFVGLFPVNSRSELEVKSFIFGYSLFMILSVFVLICILVQQLIVEMSKARICE